MRETLNLTREEWVEKVGVKKTAIYEHENEVGSPKLPILIRLKQATNVNLNWLATGKGDMLDRGPLSAEEWSELKEVIFNTVALERAPATRKAGIIYEYIRNLLDVGSSGENNPGETSGGDDVVGGSETGNTKHSA